MILNDILKTKRSEVERIKNWYIIDYTEITPSKISLYDQLGAKKMSYIMEIKRSSPSKGEINRTHDIEGIAKIYSKYATAISILADETHFSGSYDFISRVRKVTELPILCKDFIIDEFQLYLARSKGADAILLMLSILDDKTYIKFSDIAKQLQLDIITEVHTHEEASRAVNLNAEIIGINNRDFEDLSVNIKHTQSILNIIPANKIIISESGFQTYDDVMLYRKKVNGILVGSALMKDNQIEINIRQLISKRIKICGITDPDQIKSIDDFPVTYIGFIFSRTSLRAIALTKANMFDLPTTAKKVAVFKDNTIDEIQNVITSLKPDVIQLHGYNQCKPIVKYLETLPDIEIWVAVYPGEGLPNNNFRILFDNHTPGSGKTINLSVINTDIRKNAVLAGGLSDTNLQSFIDTNFFAYDFNSGLELSPGIKSTEKIGNLFKNIRIESK